METFNMQRGDSSLRLTDTYIKFLYDCPSFIVQIVECAREGEAGSEAHSLGERHRKSIHKVSLLSACLAHI